MRTQFLALIILSLTFIACSENNQKNSSGDFDPQVEQILSTLSLEDKVGEMTQLALDMLSVGTPYNVKEPQEFDTAKLRKVLLDLKVGSILNVNSHALTVKQWERIITTIQDYATNKKESGVPVIYGIDAVHGTNYTIDATLFPQQLSQAATFNRELALACGEVTAYETMASGIPWAFAPVLDLGIDPRWSRLWETYGEDVYLASEMGNHFIKGMQGDDVADQYKVAACMKHFVGYSAPKRGKDRMPAWIPERQLKEYFLPTFQNAIDAGAKTIMICSGEVNGIPVHADKRVLTDLLRGEMGFKGVAVSDWEDVKFLRDRHRIAKDYKEAVKLSVNAGMDMAMVPIDTEFPVLLKELVEEGEVSMSRIDEAVRRILQLKIDLGLFDNPVPKFSNYDKFSSKEHHAIAKGASDESIIMLKNKDILPIKKQSKIFVTGPTADLLQSLNGGWSGTWQGNNPKYDSGYALTMRKALTQKFGKTNIINGNSSLDLSRAASSDYIVLCLGEKSYTEKPGDIDDLTLPQEQLDLVKKARKLNKPIILILLEGRPRIINAIIDDVDALLLGLFPGGFGSESIADILTGDINPSGKLPITYPRYVNDLVNYNHKGTDLAHRDFSMNAFRPQFEFGHGLSYSNFAYENLNIVKDTFDMDEKITIEIDVKNTSKIKGKESVLLFISDKVASIAPPVKRLRGFKKIDLAPGQTNTVSFTITKENLAFVGLENEWITEPGAFTISIGDQSKTFYLK